MCIFVGVMVRIFTKLQTISTMKQKLLLSLFVLLSASIAWADVAINETNFPDENFRGWLLNQDLGADALITDAEIADATFLMPASRNIQSLQGIQFFTALETLWCYDNSLTELDVSGLTALVSLDCSSNKLKSLNVSGCTSLTSIICCTNDLDADGTGAFVESLPNVEEGHIYMIYKDMDRNVMTDEQVLAAKAKGWTSYYSNGWEWYEKVPEIAVNEENFPDEIFRNWVLINYDETLDGSEIASAKYLNLEDKGIRSLKGIEYFSDAVSLYCYNNLLTELDLSQNKSLTDLYCFNNQLTSLILSNNNLLSTLSIYQNRIKGEAMDALIESLPTVSNGIILAVYSEGEQNSMTFAQVAAAKAKGWTPKYGEGYSWSEYSGSGEDVAITAENFPDDNFREWLLSQGYGEDGVLSGSELGYITLINVSGKGIQSLKGIEFFPMLSSLFCAENDLTSLDVSQNIVLGNLSCNNNRISALDISKNTALTELYCNNNQLAGLDLSGCPKLVTLHCYNNMISELAMEDLVASLPTVTNWWEGTMNVIYDEYDKNVINTLQVEAAKAKGWTPKHFDFETWEWVEYPGSEPSGKKGDLNGDSKIDIADAVSVLDLMAEGKDDPAADLNGDGKVDIADFVSVLDLMAAQ